MDIEKQIENLNAHMDVLEEQLREQEQTIEKQVETIKRQEGTISYLRDENRQLKAKLDNKTSEETPNEAEDIEYGKELARRVAGTIRSDHARC
jgi:predicted  nucleic acid-binding Zn-ribbon protein